jgi:hypothetical protein
MFLTIGYFLPTLGVPTLTCATGSPEAAAAAAATEAAAAFSKLGAPKLGAALAGTGSWETIGKPYRNHTETMGKIVIYTDLTEKHKISAAKIEIEARK